MAVSAFDRERGGRGLSLPGSAPALRRAHRGRSDRRDASGWSQGRRPRCEKRVPSASTTRSGVPTTCRAPRAGTPGSEERGSYDNRDRHAGPGWRAGGQRRDPGCVEQVSRRLRRHARGHAVQGVGVLLLLPSAGAHSPLTSRRHGALPAGLRPVVQCGAATIKELTATANPGEPIPHAQGQPTKRR